MATRAAAGLRSAWTSWLPALAAGTGALILLAIAVASAHPEASPLSPDHAGGEPRWSVLYLAALSGSFALYLAGLALVASRGAPLAPVLALAVLVQIAPLVGPVLLSTDVYTYWAYGRLGAFQGENPYDVPPSSFPADPAFPRMGAAWRDTTSVYGPGFTLASEAHARLAGSSPATAGYLYRVPAALALVGITWLAARIAARPVFAAAFVGWNPLLAAHFAGGGHNDAWMMLLVLSALALAAAGRLDLAGAAWALAIAVKWVPVLFLALRLVEARASGRQVRHWGFALTAAALAALALWRYGHEWLGAVVPLARNLQEQAVYSIPHRVSQLGLPEQAAAIAFAVLLGAALVWLFWEAANGRARLALAAGALLLATPWLVPWYAIWVVPLAAVEEDRPARVLALVLSAYLLRDAVPL